MQNFAAAIEFHIAPILSRRMLGDALLAGLLTQEMDGNWQIALDNLPIATIEGVPQVSEILPGFPARPIINQTVYIRSPMRDLTHDPRLVTTLSRMPPRSSMTASRGDFKSDMSVYKWLDTPTVYFIGRGDIKRIARILRSATFIGSQRNRGHGQVKSVDVWPVANVDPSFGIIGELDQRLHVLRPIPLRLKKIFNPTDAAEYLIADETWHNPYLRTFSTAEVEPCMVPSFGQGRFFGERQIAMWGRK